MWRKPERSPEARLPVRERRRRHSKVWAPAAASFPPVSAGIAVYERGGIALMPALPAAPRDVTGAGDALVAGTLYGLLQQRDLRAAARLGLAAAAIAVESESSAAPSLTAEALYARA